MRGIMRNLATLAPFQQDWFPQLGEITAKLLRHLCKVTTLFIANGGSGGHSLLDLAERAEIRIV